MPQMSYMWWEILFMMFILSMAMMMILIYHNHSLIYCDYLNNSTNNIKQMNWKW
uniref:ATP synthase complex subunit 8 n=1 Tax=Aponsila sp. FS-2019 TaxID=2575685 RepID=A0A4D6X2Q5_9HEMI|nr:ATP synthase F0 subunit 8 [Aponsila sp. FS-2019]